MCFSIKKNLEIPVKISKTNTDGNSTKINMTNLNEDYSIQSLKSRLDIFFNSLFIKHISQIKLSRVVFYWQKYFLQAHKN